MKNGYKIMDMRSRPPYKGFLTKGYPFGLYDKERTTSIYKGSISALEDNETLAPSFCNPTMETFFAEMDEAGIDYGICPYRAAWNDPANDGYQVDNSELITMMETYPRLIGIAGLSPVYTSIEHCLAEIDEYVINGKLASIALESYMDRPNYFLNDEKLCYPLFEKCQEHNIPITLTFGSNAGVAKGQMPALIEAVRAFPKLNFICCHGAYPHAIEICHYSYLYPNIYVSPDIYMVNTVGTQTYVMAANYTLRDRLCFGTGAPVLPMKTTVDYYLNCGIREAVLGDVLFYNALKVLNLNEEDLEKI